MKKIIISTLAVLVAAPAFAGHPNQGSSWQMWGMDPYIGLSGGVGYSNLNYRFAGNKQSMTDVVIQGRAALGLEVCDTVRSEIEWSIQSKAKDKETFGTVADVDVYSKLQTVMWNAFWEFTPYQIVRPFVGMGVGIALTDVERTAPSIATYSESKTRLSAMGALGVTFDMEMFAVDLSARYNYVDVQSGWHNFGGNIGIRFMF